MVLAVNKIDKQQEEIDKGRNKDKDRILFIVKTY